ERGQALSDFYGRVYHQGTVYPATSASLPFLLELAGDPGVPDRDKIVALLVSIGEEAVDESEIDYADDVDFAGAAAFLRAHAEAFVDFGGDAACRVRQAAIPCLALFLDDADRALDLLQDRAAMTFCLRERLLVTRTTAT